MPLMDSASWKKFLEATEPNHHLLQTAEWGDLKCQFGWRATRLVAGQFGAQILFKPLPFGFSVAYVPKVSTRNFAQMQTGELGKLVEEECRKQRAVFIKVELDCWDDEYQLPLFGYTLSQHAIQPLRTITVDISAQVEEILARMKQKCRYNIRLAEKKDVFVVEHNTMDAFYELMQETGGRDGFEVHTREYYQKGLDLFWPTGRVALLIAEVDGLPLAGLMVFCVGERSWYLYGASSDRERNRMPAYLLQWKAMLWAKEQGCRTYDLWGIPDEPEEKLERDFETRSDGLWGVYRFKRGFGGVVRRSFPAMDKPLIPLLYSLYKIRQRIRGISF